MWKNYLFKKNWVYSFAFKSLPPLIQNKIKDSEKEEYIHFDTLLSTIVKILKEDKQIYAMFTHDELNVIIWRDLCKILEENRKLNEGKNKFIIKAKNNKEERFSNNNIEQKFQKGKNDNNDANDTLIKNCVVNSIIKIFNNELPIIWSDKQGNWIKVSSLPNEIKNKINIFKQNTRIKYVNLRLVLKTIIQILKEDMEINDRFLDNELEEIIVGLCSRKNIEISHFFFQ